LTPFPLLSLYSPHVLSRSVHSDLRYVLHTCDDDDNDDDGVDDDDGDNDDDDDDDGDHVGCIYLL
jgi:hypothetical protein